MIEREIPKDIRKYESKFVGPFTLRQTICVVIAAVCSLLTYNTVGKLFIQDVRAFLCFVSAVPGVAFGWIKPYGMSLENFLQVVIITMFLAPTKRVYKTINLHDIKTSAENNAEKKEKQRREKAVANYKKHAIKNSEFRPYK